MTLLLPACQVISVLNVSRKIPSSSKLPFAPNLSLICEAWTQQSEQLTVGLGSFSRVPGQHDLLVLLVSLVLDGLVLGSCAYLDQPPS